MKHNQSFGMHRLFICLMACVAGGVSGSKCETNAPIKDVHYYRQVWLENLLKSYNWTRKERLEEFKECFSDKPKAFGTFDFVIVGGGPAGAVLANRLSENAKWKVLLLEIGPDEDDFSLMPGAEAVLANSDYNWGYLTTPQKSACFGMKNNRCTLNRGKHLGGGALEGSEAYVRASRADFKRWAQISDKWSYDQCLYYYKKSENVSASVSGAKFRGVNGPQRVEHVGGDSEMVDYIIAANKELGYKVVDYNSANLVGVSRLQVTIKSGVRQSANQLYLKPVREFRKNLVVLTKALATRIRFMHNSIAIGVEYMREGQMYNVTVRKELLLCAGGYQTAQLLMLSGIGPKEHLLERNVPLVADLPVGRNLISRNYIDLRITTNVSGRCSSLEKDLYDYVNGKGVLATPPGRVVTFGKFRGAARDNPDFSIMYNLPNPYTDSCTYKGLYNYGDVMDGMVADRRSTDIIARVAYLHPTGRGVVRLKSNNPIDYVDIDPGYLTDLNELEYIYESLEGALRLLETHTFKAIGASLGGYFIPDCEGFTHSMYWHCIASYVMGGGGDPLGTCRMGRGMDSVVDQNLIVHGFVNLRVVDAGAIPVPISGNSRATEVMMGEKIADALKIKYANK